MQFHSSYETAKLVQWIFLWFSVTYNWVHKYLIFFLNFGFFHQFKPDSVHDSVTWLVIWWLVILVKVTLLGLTSLSTPPSCCLTLVTFCHHYLKLVCVYTLTGRKLLAFTRYKDQPAGEEAAKPGNTITWGASDKEWCSFGWIHHLLVCIQAGAPSWANAANFTPSQIRGKSCSVVWALSCTTIRQDLSKLALLSFLMFSDKMHLLHKTDGIWGMGEVIKLFFIKKRSFAQFINSQV